jgi:DNA-binding transcriptional MerR regulator
MRIGELAKRSEISAATIRYYEQLGLITPPPRSRAGYRHYQEKTIEELRFIKKGQALGFSLEEIGEILKIGRAGWRSTVRARHRSCRAESGRRRRAHPQPSGISRPPGRTDRQMERQNAAFLRRRWAVRNYQLGRPAD